MNPGSRTLLWSILRLLTAALITAAVIAQLGASISESAAAGRDVPTVIANFFSFFTILSNTLAAIVLAWAGTAGLRIRDGVETPALALALASVTTYMLITGIVYNLLLRQIELPQGSQPIPWSNEVLHLVGPILLLVDLLFGTRRRALPWRAIGAIIAFPLIWTAYTLVRGPLVVNPISGVPYWYPYPFLNPNNPGGWGSVAVYVVIISVAFVAVASLVVWAGRRRGRGAQTPGA